MSEPLTRKRTVRMSEGMYQRIDRARGGVPFEKWARELFERECYHYEQQRNESRPVGARK